MDEVIVFHPLGEAHIAEIVGMQVNQVRKLLEDRRITLELTDEAQTLLGKKGYDPAYGARPIKRVIQQNIQNPLAMALLKGEFREGDTVLADVDEQGGIVFSKAVA